MEAAFNSTLFTYNEHSCNLELTESYNEKQVSHDDYIHQRDRTIKYMYKHDFTVEELAETFSLAEEEIKNILSLQDKHISVSYSNRVPNTIPDTVINRNLVSQHLTWEDWYHVVTNRIKDREAKSHRAPWKWKRYYSKEEIKEILEND